MKKSLFRVALCFVGLEFRIKAGLVRDEAQMPRRRRKVGHCHGCRSSGHSKSFEGGSTAEKIFQPPTKGT